VTVLVRFSAEAASELDDATAWYDKQAPGLGDSFIDAVEAAIAIIADWPQSGAPVVGIPDGRDVRRAPVARFCRLSG
jgi:plasmid stabilization system protein ParE